MTYKDLFLNSESESNTDMDILTLALDKGYVGRFLFTDKIIDNAINKLKNLEEHSENLAEECANILEQIPDFHIQVNKNHKNYIKRIKNQIDVGSNLNESTQNWQGIKTDNTYVLAIKSMPSGEWAGLNEFLFEAVQHATKIVIDLRDNEGGDSTMGIKIVETLAGQKVASPYSEVIRYNTPEALVMWINTLQKFMLTSNEQAKVILQKYLNKAEKDLNRALTQKHQQKVIKTKYEDSNIPILDPTKIFEGRILILQNSKTMSAAENMIDHFEYLPNVLKIGTKTYGCVQSGNIGFLILPKSKIAIQMATQFTTYKDNRISEGIGVEPDIALENGIDAYRYALTL
ncbi:hypothetical protein KC980_03370 [candidate division WWE3 bacterium]|uniref:Tail specific protease domain-containing protein n=1 Tax=candidate division WWE3 bacterium TaxID=2053526 RepID=A0A955EC23_UNCKA|nr:hypothetical protein [candidate division WWE3 bacterium]